MNADTYIKGQLAAFCIHEAARHGGVENMVAVANVMRNRVMHGWYGGDWMETIEKAIDHTGCIYLDEKKTRLRDTNVRIFLQRIDDIYSGAEEDNTEGALFYAELAKVNRYWFTKNVSSRMHDHPMIATIGPVSFFG